MQNEKKKNNQFTCRPGIAAALNLFPTLLFCAIDDATMASTCCWAATEASRAAARTIEEKCGAGGAAILLAFDFAFVQSECSDVVDERRSGSEDGRRAKKSLLPHFFFFFSSQLGFFHSLSRAISL